SGRFGLNVEVVELESKRRIDGVPEQVLIPDHDDGVIIRAPRHEADKKQEAGEDAGRAHRVELAEVDAGRFTVSPQSVAHDEEPRDGKKDHDGVVALVEKPHPMRLAWVDEQTV